MAIKHAADWQKLPVTLAELCIDTTLRCGQSFRWRKINDEWYSQSHPHYYNDVMLTIAGLVRFVVAYCH